MQPLNILIVEDNILAAMDIRQALKKAGHRVTSIARTLQDALSSVTTHPPDLALIDVQLEESSTGNGIETAKKLLACHSMPIIYLTANSEPAAFQKAKETMPAAYLLKPFRANELNLHIELAYHNFQHPPPNPTDKTLSRFLLLPIDKGIEKIDLDDVVYLEADGPYARVFMVDKSFFLISTSMGQLEQYFPTSNFFRLSRSHIVNLSFLKRIKDNKIHLIDSDTVLPIPESGRKEILKKLTTIRTKPMSKKGD